MALGTSEADRLVAMGPGGIAPGEWLVVLPVLIPIAVGALLLMFRHQMRWHGLIAVGGLGLALAANVALVGQVLQSGPQVMVMGNWKPPFGIAFTADLLGAGFSLAAAFAGMAATLFSLRDVGPTARRYGFYPFLMLLMAGVSGAFLTGDIFNLYVWFEVFVISSFGLLVLGSERAQLDGAIKYTVLNLVGTTLFLITTALLYGTFGTLNMADLAGRIRSAGLDAPLAGLAVLFLLAFGMKAAAFPLNFWLPASYHTPRIVVAALFGGLLTKVGVYALLRVLGMLMPAERLVLSGTIACVAAATMLVGAMGALAQSDLRRIAGFIVIHGVGVMLAGLAIGGVPGLSGAVFYAMQSMLAMTAMYLFAGLIRDMTGSYDLHNLGGLHGRAPGFSALAVLLLLAAAGLPPGSGLWPKVMLVKAGLDGDWWWLTTALLVSSLFLTIVLFRIYLLAFWRAAPETRNGAGSAALPPMALGYAALMMLVAPILWMGLLPETVASGSLAAAAALIDPSAYIERVLLPGGTP